MAADVPDDLEPDDLVEMMGAEDWEVTPIARDLGRVWIESLEVMTGLIELAEEDGDSFAFSSEEEEHITALAILFTNTITEHLIEHLPEECMGEALGQAQLVVGCMAQSILMPAPEFIEAGRRTEQVKTGRIETLDTSHRIRKYLGCSINEGLLALKDEAGRNR